MFLYCYTGEEEGFLFSGIVRFEVSVLHSSLACSLMVPYRRRLNTLLRVIALRGLKL